MRKASDPRVIVAPMVNQKPPRKARGRIFALRLTEAEHAMLHEAAFIATGDARKASKVFRDVVVKAARRIVESSRK